MSSKIKQYHRTVTQVLEMVLLQDITEWSILTTSLRDSADTHPPEAEINREMNFMDGC